MSAWVPVEKVLPPEFSKVLVWLGLPVSAVAIAWYARGAWQIPGRASGRRRVVTHWRPLPPPPEAS